MTGIAPRLEQVSCAIRTGRVWMLAHASWRVKRLQVSDFELAAAAATLTAARPRQWSVIAGCRGLPAGLDDDRWTLTGEASIGATAAIVAELSPCRQALALQNRAGRESGPRAAPRGPDALLRGNHRGNLECPDGSVGDREATCA